MILSGDVHQLALHIRCARTSTVAINGDCEEMCHLLVSKDFSVIPLITMFRPILLWIDCQTVYSTATASHGTPERQRCKVTYVLCLPNLLVPFLLVQVEGIMMRSAGGSQSNET